MTWLILVLILKFSNLDTYVNPYPAEFTINRAEIGDDLAWDAIIHHKKSD